MEWLEVDGLGGYAMGTADGVRTRRYHAWLVAATQPPEATWESLVSPALERFTTEFASVVDESQLMRTREILGGLGARPGIDVLVAGGATDLDGIRRLRDAGIAGIILGEALLSGAIDFRAAMEAAA